MARKVFYSFHYDNDCWRTQQVRNIGMIEGNKSLTANDWEEVKKGGDAAIEKWIKDQLDGRSCAIVLVGAETANRKWVRQEIIHAWNMKKGVVGIRIHSLKDSSGFQSSAGPNPFEQITLGDNRYLSEVAKLYSPSGFSSTDVYNTIKENIETWVEQAVQIRNNN